MSTLPAASDRYLALNQLADWMELGQSSLAQDWIRTHREAALDLVLETYVDVHASGLLNMSSWYPQSAQLLPVLEQVLGLDCGAPEPHPVCASRAEEVKLLVSFHLSGLETRMKLLPSELEGFDLSILLVSDKEFGDWSERGRYQMKLELGAYGVDLAERLTLMEEALLLARSWRSAPAEMLAHLGLAEIWAAYSHSESFQQEGLPQMPEHQANLRSRNHLRRAQLLSQELNQPALAAELSMRQALLKNDPVGLEHSEALIAKVTARAWREALQLLLADNRVWLKQQARSRDLSRRLLDQGSPETGLQVIRRWLHMGHAQDLQFMKALFEQGQRPELNTELVRVYPLLGQASVLLTRFKQETAPELRRAMTHALVDVLSEAQEGDVIFELSFLLTDPDPDIRGTVANAMLHTKDAGLMAQAARLLEDPELEVRRAVASGISNSEDPQLKARLFPLLESPDPSLRSAALSAAGSLHHPELLPKVLPLLRLENRNELMLVVELVKKWGSVAHIPRLQALLPALTLHEQFTVKLAMAYLQGPEQWLAELIRQAETPEHGAMLGLNLAEALNARFITHAQLKPYLKHPNQSIREMIRELSSLQGD